MFLANQNKADIDKYKKMLQAIGSLSNLFSESTSPYIYYRVAENLFCKSFNARNLSRSDTAIDAEKDGMGVGVKTFLLRSGHSFEKVAEFNKEVHLLNGLSDADIAVKISELRNKRLDFAVRNYQLKKSIYHCVARGESSIKVYETPMSFVDTENISGVLRKENVIKFKDGLNDYHFNISKSTLFRHFTPPSFIFDIEVKIIKDPFEIIENMFSMSIKDLVSPQIKSGDHIFLPLYSYKGDDKFVYEKSGLNQWNASGRTRDLSEVYIPIPKLIHDLYPGFFPGRDEQFSLKLPNGEVVSASVCQDNSKALMTNPNKKLGEWLLREVLNLKEGELLTYEKLESVGIDSAVIYKKSEGNYEIDFAKLGSFEEFSGASDTPSDDVEE